MTLNERKLNILAAIVKNYIETGEPVGSKMLCMMEKLNLSSATIRNEMSELVELNLLEQPHTSAGRIPTPLGYRFYIEKLMKHYSLSEEDKKYIDSLLPSFVDDPHKLIDLAALALSELTHCTVISTTPADKDGTIKKVELFLLNRRTVMIILITSSGIVKNKNSRSEVDLNAELLERFAKLVEDNLYGKLLSDFTAALVQSLAVKAAELIMIFTPLIVTLYEVVREASEVDLTLKGELKLLEYREFSDGKAKELLEFLSQRQSMMSMLSNNDRELAIYLGMETGEKALASSSLVVARYYRAEQNFGSIGVIGPNRMDYEHIIPSIEYFAKSIGRLLSETFSD